MKKLIQFFKSLLTGRIVVIVPYTSDSEGTYSSLMSVLATPAFKDYLRVQISETASELSAQIVGKETLDRARVSAGKMEAFKFLLYDAPRQIEKALEMKIQDAEREKTETKNIFSVFNHKLRDVADIGGESA